MNCEFMKDLRHSRGWSLDAAVVNMEDVTTKQSLNSYESGKIDPPVKVLEKMAQVYNVPIAWITDPQYRVKEWRIEWR